MTGASEVAVFKEGRNGFKEGVQKSPVKEALLLFGQGPVIHPVTGEKAEAAATEPGTERVNFWSEDLAKASVEISLLDPQRTEGGIVIMGGRTGGDKYKSEAELIAENIKSRFAGKEIKEDKKIPGIVTEEASMDTLQNVINYLNQRDFSGRSHDEKIQDGSLRVNLLCAPYHTLRTQLIMKLFRVPVEHVFSSDEVLRYAARYDKGWDEDILSEFEHKLGKYGSAFFDKQKGSDLRGYMERALYDNLWLRELIERPDKWLCEIGKVESDERIMLILRQFEELYPGELAKRNIDLSVGMEDLRKGLSKIRYRGLTPSEVAQWVENSKMPGDSGRPLEVNKLLYRLFPELKMEAV